MGVPFKDTSGPSMNILIKLSTIVALIIAPHIARKPKLDMTKLNSSGQNIEQQHGGDYNH